ncbi:class I SAM-dependent methyltransferase [Candidatus Uhrbacteria bacterium]|nr:class I SAM-dependent methyltransferase [Candidatus Uhrbacteria bacterium]
MNCPICDSGNYQVLLRHGKDRYIKKLSCPKIQYVLCRECGFTFQNPQPDGEALKRFYVEGEFETSTSEKYFRVSREDAQSKIVWLKKNYGEGEGENALEIGSSSGIFLNELKKCGWNVFGIEPSVPFSKYSRDYFGLNIQTGFFSERTFHHEKFDLIVALHILEHVPDPLNFLQNIHARLNKKGVLFLEVPNIFGMRADRAVTDYFSSIHLMMFTPKTIVGLLGKAHFVVTTLTITDRGISVLAIPGTQTTFEKENNKKILRVLKQHAFKHQWYLLQNRLLRLFRLFKSRN